MYSHVTVGSSNLVKSTAFYNAVLTPIGLIQRPVRPDGGPLSSCWVVEGAALPRFYVYEPFNGDHMSVGNGSMTAFLAPSEEAVKSAFSGGIEKGGTSSGKPGARPRYGKGYFGAYILDPDGNKIHIVYRGDVIKTHAS